MAEPACSKSRQHRLAVVAITLWASLALWLGTARELAADSAQYFYDPAGRLIAMIDPVNGSAQYTYDAVGNILSVVRRPSTDIMVAQVSPSRGVPGTVVTIFGTGFGTTSDTTVSFNGQPATPSVVTATQITLAVPAGAASGPVSVTSPAGAATSVASFTVPQVSAPVISGISPSQIDQGGTITISGSGFDPQPGNQKVLVNGRYALVSTATSSTLTAVVPAGSSGRVSVLTADGSATSADYLVVPPSPYLASSIGAVTASSIGSSPTVTIGTPGKIGLIIFEATAGHRLRLSVSNASFSNATLHLYGPDGAPIGSALSVSNGASTDTNVLAVGGTYTALIAPGSTVTGAATINLIDVPPDASAVISANAVPVSLTTGAVGQGMRLTFTGIAGHRVSLLTQVSGMSGCSSYNLSVLFPNSTSQLYAGSQCDSGSLWSDMLTLWETGTYTIVLQPTGTNVGTGTFTLYDVPPDVTATISANASPVSVTNAVMGQNMRLTFNGGAGQHVALMTQVSGFTGCLSYGVTILQPDGITKVYSNSQCGTASIWTDVLTLPVAGTYTIVLDPFGMNMGTGTFTLYDVPPDVTATISANASPVSVTNAAVGQSMRLTFNAGAGEHVALMTQVSGFTGCLSYAITILQPDGITKVYSNSQCGTASIWSDVLILPVAGTYTIVLDPLGTNVGTGTFTLYDVPPDVTGTILPNATPVSLTTTAFGQGMRLTFSATAGQRVGLLTQVSGFTGCLSYAITILQPNGTTKVYSNSQCGTASIWSDVLILPVAGTYTIVLDPLGTNVGTGTFTLYDLASDATAAITPGGGTVSLTTTSPGLNMRLTFNATAGQRVSLLTQVSGFSGGCFSYAVTILQPDGATKVYGNSACGTGSIWSDVLTLPVAGAYTIVLDPSGTNTGTGTFTLYDVPPDAAGTTSVGQAAANYDVTVPGQSIRIGFAGQASQSISVGVGRVSSTPAGACYNITTLKPDGSVLRGDGACGNSYASGSLTLPADGTYTVVVHPTNVSIGTFSVGVFTP